MSSAETMPIAQVTSFKTYERILNNNDEPFVNKINSLILVWKSVHSICNEVDTRSKIRIMDWTKLQTLNVVLNGEWTNYKDIYETPLILEVFKYQNEVNTWGNDFARRFQRLINVIKNPWGDVILKNLLNNSNVNIGQKEIDFFCEETAYFISMRLKKLCESNCEDFALNLVTAFINCYKLSVDGHFKLNATKVQMLFCFDVNIALLYKFHRNHQIMELLTSLNAEDALQLVKRFSKKRVRISQVWEHYLEITELACQIFVTQYVFCDIDQCREQFQALLRLWCDIALEHNLLQSLEISLQGILPRAISTTHIYLCCDILFSKFGTKLRTLVVEMYIIALTTDINSMEAGEQDDAIVIRLAEGYISLSEIFKENTIFYKECILTAFSLKPTLERLNIIEDIARKAGLTTKKTKRLWKCRLHSSATEQDNNLSNCSLCGKLMSRSNLNLTIHIPVNFDFDNIMRPEVLDLSKQLCNDLLALINGPRYKLLSWLQPWREFHILCRRYTNDMRHTKNFITELKYLKIDYSIFSKCQKDPVDIFTGIEKGYEHYLYEDQADKNPQLRAHCSNSVENKLCGPINYLPQTINENSHSIVKALRAFRTTKQKQMLASSTTSVDTCSSSTNLSDINYNSTSYYTELTDETATIDLKCSNNEYNTPLDGKLVKSKFCLPTSTFDTSNMYAKVQTALDESSRNKTLARSSQHEPTTVQNFSNVSNFNVTLKDSISYSRVINTIPKKRKHFCLTDATTSSSITAFKNLDSPKKQRISTNFPENFFLNNINASLTNFFIKLSLVMHTPPIESSPYKTSYEILLPANAQFLNLCRSTMHDQQIQGLNELHTFDMPHRTFTEVHDTPAKLSQISKQTNCKCILISSNPFHYKPPYNDYLVQDYIKSDIRTSSQSKKHCHTVPTKFFNIPELKGSQNVCQNDCPISFANEICSISDADIVLRNSRSRVSLRRLTTNVNNFNPRNIRNIFSKRKLTNHNDIAVEIKPSGHFSFNATYEKFSNSTEVALIKARDTNIGPMRTVDHSLYTEQRMSCPSNSTFLTDEKSSEYETKRNMLQTTYDNSFTRPSKLSTIMTKSPSFSKDQFRPIVIAREGNCSAVANEILVHKSNSESKLPGKCKEYYSMHALRRVIRKTHLPNSNSSIKRKIGSLNTFQSLTELHKNAMPHITNQLNNFWRSVDKSARKYKGNVFSQVEDFKSNVIKSMSDEPNTSSVFSAKACDIKNFRFQNRFNPSTVGSNKNSLHNLLVEGDTSLTKRNTNTKSRRINKSNMYSWGSAFGICDIKPFSQHSKKNYNQDIDVSDNMASSYRMHDGQDVILNTSVFATRLHKPKYEKRFGYFRINNRQPRSKDCSQISSHYNLRRCRRKHLRNSLAIKSKRLLQKIENKVCSKYNPSPKSIINRIQFDKAYIRAILRDVPGVKDYRLIIPYIDDTVVNVIQVSERIRSSPCNNLISNSSNHQNIVDDTDSVVSNSTQITPHIQRIGQPRSLEKHTANQVVNSDNESSVERNLPSSSSTKSKHYENNSDNSTQSTLVSMLSQHIGCVRQGSSNSANSLQLVKSSASMSTSTEDLNNRQNSNISPISAESSTTSVPYTQTKGVASRRQVCDRKFNRNNKNLKCNTSNTNTNDNNKTQRSAILQFVCNSSVLPKFQQAFGKANVFNNNPSTNNNNANSNQTENPIRSCGSVTSTTVESSVECDVRENKIHFVDSNGSTRQISTGTTIKKSAYVKSLQQLHGGVIYTRQMPIGQAINVVQSGARGHQVFRIATSNPELVKETVMQGKMGALLAAAFQGSSNKLTRDEPVNANNSEESNEESASCKTNVASMSTESGTFNNNVDSCNAKSSPKSVVPPTDSVSRSSSPTNLSSTTLEQLREFDMVYRQVKERSITVEAPNEAIEEAPSNANKTRKEVSAQYTNSSTYAITAAPAQRISLAYVNQGQRYSQISPVMLVSGYCHNLQSACSSSHTIHSQSVPTLRLTPRHVSSVTAPTVIVNTSKFTVQHHLNNGLPSSVASTATTSSATVSLSSSFNNKSKLKKAITKADNTNIKVTNTLPATTVATNVSKILSYTSNSKPQQRPQEDEQTTQRIFDILAEYAEQLRSSPDLNNKPAPRRRSNPPTTTSSHHSKRKKSSQTGSSKGSIGSTGGAASGGSSLASDADMEDSQTLGSEDGCSVSLHICEEQETKYDSCNEGTVITPHLPVSSFITVSETATSFTPTVVTSAIPNNGANDDNNDRTLPIDTTTIGDGAINNSISCSTNGSVQRNMLIKNLTQTAENCCRVSESVRVQPTQTAVLVPAGNYIMSMPNTKNCQQIAVVSGSNTMLATVPARTGQNLLLFQSFINQTTTSAQHAPVSSELPNSNVANQHSTTQQLVDSFISYSTTEECSSQDYSPTAITSHGSTKLNRLSDSSVIAIKKLSVDSNHILASTSHTESNNCTKTECNSVSVTLPIGEMSSKLIVHPLDNHEHKSVETLIKDNSEHNLVCLPSLSIDAKYKNKKRMKAASATLAP